MGGYKTLDSLDGECTHVIQTRQEYEMLLNQRDRAQREKEDGMEKCRLIYNGLKEKG